MGGESQGKRLDEDEFGSLIAGSKEDFLAGDVKKAELKNYLAAVCRTN